LTTILTGRTPGSNDLSVFFFIPSHEISFIMQIPSLILKQLYSFGSLANIDGGIKFSIKNRLSDATLNEISRVVITGEEIPLKDIHLDLGNGQIISPLELNQGEPMGFPLRMSFDVICKRAPILPGIHQIEVEFKAEPLGKLKLKVEGSFTDKKSDLPSIPRNDNDDYTKESIRRRQEFLEKQTGKKLKHIKQYSFDPHITAGNCEHFIGVAQVPMGLAGPITINGEHAKGDFLIPMATAEGTLIASYNRGMKLLNLCGGVTCTIQDDAMQRAPAFVFENARGARDFVKWITENIDKIREEAEATTSIGKLKYIDPFLASKMAFLRFNFTTGDAAGQNMIGRATFAACGWILEQYKDHKITNFYLESNLATDKKASQINVMRTRGKRVTAECIIPKDILAEVMRVSSRQLAYHYNVTTIGTILSGANSNGLHAANGITAMFIATGQDVANIAESSTSILNVELMPNEDLYVSITLPSLIVATYGGGTALATQKETLELLGCYGAGTVNKFAEIVAGVVLAGELSLGAAISSSDWVSSHEQYGRNK
jgi:hydroxymethylglutaryl-CoA reductase (NADPH)